MHLGDVLNDRYQIFRKLGVGSQSTVWLARDSSAVQRHYVAVKVFGAKIGESETKPNFILRPISHTGEKHVQVALDTFMVEGPNGRHLCIVLEPLDLSLKYVLDDAFDHRAELNEPEGWLGRVLAGDQWSGKSGMYRVD